MNKICRMPKIQNSKFRTNSFIKSYVNKFEIVQMKNILSLDHNIYYLTNIQIAMFLLTTVHNFVWVSKQIILLIVKLVMYTKRYYVS